jgi:hypothetical protein
MGRDTYGVIDEYSHFRGTCFLHLQGRVVLKMETDSTKTSTRICGSTCFHNLDDHNFEPWVFCTRSACRNMKQKGLNRTVKKCNLLH